MQVAFPRQNEAGQGLLEYVLIIVLISFVAGTGLAILVRIFNGWS